MKNIVFDLGRVVFAQDPRKSSDEFKQFFSYVQQTPMPQFWVDYDLGVSTLDDVVREVISTMAEGCQVSRLGENNFLVSPFASRATAERVAQAISKCDDALVVEVQEVKPEAVEENAEKEE